MSCNKYFFWGVRLLWMIACSAALPGAFTGCGSKATSVPAPTAAQAISDFQQMAMDAFEHMAARPETAGGQLDILLETVEVRLQEYGEPFIGYRNLVQEVRKSWVDKPSAKAVKEGIARLREAAAAMESNEG
jgi:hypothetical protein